MVGRIYNQERSVSRLTDPLRQARQVDPQLGADLEAEISALTKRRTFGLVFERHQPRRVVVTMPGSSSMHCPCSSSAFLRCSTLES